jgi:hypothetical protein
MGTNNALTLPPDASNESSFRAFGRALGAQLAAMGLVKTNDTGQINWDQAEARALTANPSFPVVNALDANAAVVYQSTAAPSVGNPQWIIIDAGAGNTFAPGSWAAYTSNVPADPKDVVLAWSNDGAAWTDVDSRSLLASTGYQPFNLVGAPAKRMYRLLVNSTQSTSTYLQISEFQLWTGAGLTGTRLAPAAIRPTAANTSAGFEVWRMADGLQSTAPAFLRVEYGTGASPNFPSLWLTLGTTTDGAGTLTGVAVSERRQLACSSNVTTPQKCAISGANNRFAAAMFYNSTAFIFFALERSRDGAGADTGAGLVLIGQNSASKFAIYVPAGAVPPATETDFGCLAPSVGTGLRSNRVAFYGIKPLIPEEQPAMLTAMAYFNTDLTAEVALPDVQLYGSGAGRTLFPIGNQITTTARGNANTRLALLWE